MGIEISIYIIFLVLQCFLYYPTPVRNIKRKDDNSLLNAVIFMDGNWDLRIHFWRIPFVFLKKKCIKLIANNCMKRTWNDARGVARWWASH